MFSLELAEKTEQNPELGRETPAYRAIPPGGEDPSLPPPRVQFQKGRLQTVELGVSSKEPNFVSPCMRSDATEG